MSAREHHLSASLDDGAERGASHYLESHRVLDLMRELVQVCVTSKDADPLHTMIQHLASSAPSPSAFEGVIGSLTTVGGAHITTNNLNSPLPNNANNNIFRGPSPTLAVPGEGGSGGGQQPGGRPQRGSTTAAAAIIPSFVYQDQDSPMRRGVNGTSNGH